MTQERWEEIKQLIVATFRVVDSYEEDLDPGTAEVIEFETPDGLLKASFATRPRVIDKKTLYSNRAGGDVRVEFEYSPEDTVVTFSVSRWDEAREAWNQIDSERLF